MAERAAPSRYEELTRQLEDMGFDSGEVRVTVEDPTVTTLTSAIEIILKRQEQQQLSEVRQEIQSPVLRLRPSDAPSEPSPLSSKPPEIHSRYDSSWRKNIQRQEEEKLKVEMSLRKKEREEARQRALQEFQADRKRVRLLHGDHPASPPPITAQVTVTAKDPGIRLRILNAADRKVILERCVKPGERMAEVLEGYGHALDEICLRMPPSTKFEGEDLQRTMGELLGETRSCQLLMGPRICAAPPLPERSASSSSDAPESAEENQNKEGGKEEPRRFPGVGYVLENDEVVEQEPDENQEEEAVEEEAVEVQEMEEEQVLEEEGAEQQANQIPDLVHPNFPGMGVRVHPMDPGPVPDRREPARAAAGRAAYQRPGRHPQPSPAPAVVSASRGRVIKVKTLTTMCRKSAVGWIARADCPIYVMRQLRGLPSEQAGELVDDLIKDGRFAPRIVPYLPSWLTHLDLSRYALITNQLLHQVCQRLPFLTHLNLDASQPMMNVDGLRSVAGLQHLESLSLCGQNRLDASGLALIIIGCSSLRALVMRHSSLGSDAAFNHLVREYFGDSASPSSNQLSSLDLSGCDHLSPDGLLGLRCFPKLVFLRLVSCPQLVNLKPGDIPPLDSLKVLELPCGDRVTGDEVDKLMWG